jgi:hypothetical protein
VVDLDHHGARLDLGVGVHLEDVIDRAGGDAELFEAGEQVRAGVASEVGASASSSSFRCAMRAALSVKRGSAASGSASSAFSAFRQFFWLLPPITIQPSLVSNAW